MLDRLPPGFAVLLPDAPHGTDPGTNRAVRAFPGTAARAGGLCGRPAHTVAHVRRRRSGQAQGLPRTTALTDALASGALASRFADRDCEAFTSFMTARRRRYPSSSRRSALGW